MVEGSRNFRGSVMPSRELRLLVDGLETWARRLASEDAGSVSSIGVIEGRSGVGKSSLILSLSEACPGLGLRFFRVPSEPTPSGRRLSWSSLLERALAEESPEVAQVIDSWGPVLRSYLPGLSWPDTMTVAPRLPPRETRSRLVDAVVETIITVARRVPTVLAIEDLEHADPLSRAVVRRLVRALDRRARRRRDHRLLLVLTGEQTRSGCVFGLDEDISDRVVAFRFEMRGLTREDLASAAQRALGEELGVELRESILRCTRGDVRPVRWLLHRFATSDQRDPAPLDELVARRLEELSTDTRDVLLRFALGAVGLALGEGEDVEEAHHARALHEAGWLTYRGGDPELASSHVLDPALARILVDRCPGDVVERLRATIASRLVREADRGEIAERDLVRASELVLSGWRAVEASRASRGGAQPGEGAGPGESTVLALAARASAWLEAIGCVREALEIEECALELFPRDGLEAERAQDRVLDLLELSGNEREAVDLARRRAARGGDRIARAWLLLRAARLQRALGELDEAERLHAEAKELAGGSPEAQAEILCERARLEIERGDLAAARGFHELAGKVWRGDRGPGRAPTSWIEVARDLCVASRDSRALEFETCLRRRAEARGDLLGRIESLLASSRLLRRAGERKAAARCLEEADRDALRSRCRALSARVAHEKGELLFECESLDESLRCFHRAWGLLVELGLGDAATLSEARLAELELRTGRFLAGARTISSWLERFASSRDLATLPPPPTSGRAARADELIAAGEISAAYRTLEEALGRSEEASLAETRAPIVFRLGRLAFARGDLSFALSSLDQCLKSLATAPDRPLLAEASLEVGAILLERGSHRRAFDQTLRALRIALEIGAPALVSRALSGLAEFLVEFGDLESAESIARSSVDVARLARQPALELVALALAGRAASEQGQRERADARFDEALGLEERVSDPMARGRLWLERGWHRLRNGRFEGAHADATRGLEAARSRGLARAEEDFRFLQASVEGHGRNPLCNFLRAVDSLSRALARAESSGRTRRVVELLERLAEVYERRGKTELARGPRERACGLREALVEAWPRGWIAEGRPWHRRGQIPPSILQRAGEAEPAGVGWAPQTA